MGRDARKRQTSRKLKKKAGELHEAAVKVAVLHQRLEGGHEGLAEDLAELEQLRQLVPELRGELANARATVETIRELQVSLEEDLETSDRELAEARDALAAAEARYELLAKVFQERVDELTEARHDRDCLARERARLDILASAWVRVLAIAKAAGGEVEVTKDGDVSVMVGARSVRVDLETAEQLVGLG